MKGNGTIFFVSFVLVFVANLQNAESVVKKYTFSETKDALQPIRKHCIDRVGTDAKVIDNALKGNFASDRKLKCYYKCVMLNVKMMKNDKVVERALVKIAEHMLEESSVPLVTKGLEQCHSVATKSMEGCDLAFEFMKCLYGVDPQLLFFP